MDRTQATTYLTEEFRELATDAKFSSQQITDAYNVALDNALRHLAVAESDLTTATVADADVMKFLALIEYYALKRFVRLLSVRFDVEAGNGAIKAQRSQAFDMVKQLLNDAELECVRLGLSVGAIPAAYQVGRLQLDFLEPGCTTGEF